MTSRAPRMRPRRNPIPTEVHGGQHEEEQGPAGPVCVLGGDGDDQQEQQVGDGSGVYGPGQRGQWAVEHPGGLQDDGYDAQQHRDHEHRRREEAPRVASCVAAHEFAAPRAGGHELADQLAPALPWPLGDDQLRVEPDQVPGRSDAQIQFPVLAAPEGLVVQVHLGEHLPAEHPEVGGLRRSLRGAVVVCRPPSPNRLLYALPLRTGRGSSPGPSSAHPRSRRRCAAAFRPPGWCSRARARRGHPPAR